MPDPIVADGIAFIAFFVLTIGYHWFYIIVMRKHPTWSVRSRMHEHRRNWVELVFKRGERIMAVQALRNLIMTNTFMASTMILLVAFIANFFVLADPSETLHFTDSQTFFTGATPLQVKGGLLLILYSYAFVMLLTSLRGLNHISVLVGVDPDHLRSVEQGDPVQYIGNRLNEVETQTTYGRRSIYYSIAVFGWLFSPWIFLALSVTMWLYFVAVMDFTRPAELPSKEGETRSLTGAPANK